MKRFWITTIIAFVCGAHSSFAQFQRDPLAEPPQRPQLAGVKNGIFANIHSGASYTGFSQLEKDLKKDNMYGNKLYVRGLGSVIGGSLNGIIAGRIMLSASITRMDHDASGGAAKGESHLKSITYGGAVGFAVCNKNRHIVYPYIGYQTGKSTLKLYNYDRADITFGDNGTIERIDYKNYTSTIGSVDIGCGYRFNTKDKGGIMIGVDAGVNINVSGSNWKDSDVTVSNVKKAQATGGYIRFTLGGGFFGLKN